MTSALLKAFCFDTGHCRPRKELPKWNFNSQPSDREERTLERRLFLGVLKSHHRSALTTGKALREDDKSHPGIWEREGRRAGIRKEQPAFLEAAVISQTQGAACLISSQRLPHAPEPGLPAPGTRCCKAKAGGRRDPLLLSKSSILEQHLSDLQARGQQEGWSPAGPEPKSPRAGACATRCHPGRVCVSCAQRDPGALLLKTGASLLLTR